MSAFFDRAHPMLAEAIGLGAIVVILAVFVYIITHDDGRR
jgi:hypothetical protein